MHRTLCRRWASVVVPSLVVVVILLDTATRVDTATRAARGAEAAVGGGAAARALEWPNWRGPEQNGISRQTGLVDEIDPRGDHVLWRNDQVGTISSPIVMNGRVYLLCRDQPDTPREGEKLVALDAATGKILWENRFNVWHSDVPDTRVGWANCVGDPETGRVYALGVSGYFLCADGETGETVWSRTLHEEFGLLSTYGGRTNTPIIFEDLVIVSGVFIGWGERARPDHCQLAMDKGTGEVVWFSGTRPLPDDTTYSTPMVTTLAGQAAMVFGAGDGSIWGFQPRTGVPIFNHRISLRGLNVSPVVVDGRVYTGHSEENVDDETQMGAVVAFEAVGRGELPDDVQLWKHNEVMVGKSSPLVFGGRMYTFDDGGAAQVFDVATGEPIGRRLRLVGTMMRSSAIYADGRIYACTTSAWHVLVPTTDGMQIASRGRLPRDEECYGSPAVAGGRIYLPTTSALYCFGLPDVQPQAAPLPDPVPEEPVDSDPAPAWVQVVPAEVLLSPDATQAFRVRLFNARGQLLGDSPAEFTLEGPGEIDAAGHFRAPSEPLHRATFVRARVGELTGEARVRIVPPLPWRFDFSDGEVPITWVGARYRHKIGERDGDTVMIKRNDIPKGTRSQAFMGPSDLANYTIQADVLGDLKDNKLPDVGVLAAGYTLDLMGQSQQLQIRSWSPQLNRFSATVAYAWRPHVWYTLKLQTAVEGDRAVVRGKVWPRGEPEPDEWTVEAVDPQPTYSGSPGLYGNAKDAEIFLDNIVVTPNAP